MLALLLWNVVDGVWQDGAVGVSTLWYVLYNSVLLYRSLCTMEEWITRLPYCLIASGTADRLINYNSLIDYTSGLTFLSELDLQVCLKT